MGLFNVGEEGWFSDGGGAPKTSGAHAASVTAKMAVNIPRGLILGLGLGM